MDFSSLHSFLDSYSQGKLEQRPQQDGSEMNSVIDVEEIDGVSKEQLLKINKDLEGEIKLKDIELEKIHKLFKETSSKLEEMDDIIKDNQETVAKLKDSETEIQKLREEQKKNEDKIKSEISDAAVEERNKMNENLSKMMGISQLLGKLRARADQADEMALEIIKLKQERHSWENGANGDELPKKRDESACRQCDKYVADFRRIKTESEAERNFHRDRIHSLEVARAEFILYKMKYEDAEYKVLKLKEILIKSESSGEQVRDLRPKLEEAELHLKESNCRIEELINIVESQEINLKRRESYIAHLHRQVQQSFAGNSSKISLSIECVPPAKVQSIIQQLSIEYESTNCKCGFKNCQCGNVLESRSNNSSEPSLQCGQQICTTEASDDTFVSEKVATVSRNLEMSQVQSSNSMNPLALNEVVQNLEASLHTSLCEKNNELCEFQSRLSKELAENEKLEKRLTAHCEEIRKLRPLLSLQGRCQNLEEKLIRAKSNEADRLKELGSIRRKCAKFCEKNGQLLRHIKELKSELEKQRKYEESPAKLLHQRSQKKKCQTAEVSIDGNKDTLRKFIFDLKKQYEALKLEKQEMAICYENNLKVFKEESKVLKGREMAAKESECHWSISEESNDILLRKIFKFGLKSLQRDELIDLQNRVQVAMMKLRKLTPGLNNFSFDCFTKIADELRLKHNLSDDLPSMNPEDLPVKDIDMISSKTLPPVLRSTRSKAFSKDKFRARSALEVNSKSDSEAAGKCVTIVQKKSNN